MIKIPSFAIVVLALSGGPALAVNLMLDFGATPVADPYLNLSPGHSSGAISAGETTWNTISSATPPSSLSYSNGTTATGVTLGLGQEATGGNNVINLANAISNVALAGGGGGIANQRNLLVAGSIYGDNSSSTAVGRDGFFGGGVGTSTGAAIGISLTGLAAGTYQIYVMARNTNSNPASYPMKIYTGVGAASGTFDFSALTASNESNVGYATAAYTDQYTRFANGENYVEVSVTLGQGQTLFIAVDGGDDTVDRRGFLNMVQVVQVPESAASVLLGAGCLLLAVRRRR